MKKWLYVISVGSMTALFLVFYLSHMKEAEANEAARIAKAKNIKAAADAKKLEDEKRARDDAAKRTEERARETAAKEAEKQKKWDDDTRDILNETKDHIARGAKASKEVATLETQLDALRKNKEKLNREAFESAKMVERAQVEKQNAEIETQRFIEMISRRAADSSLTRMPVPVAVAPPR
jgi:hypothetical protein